MRSSFGWETSDFGNYVDLATLAARSTATYGLGGRPGLAALAERVQGLAIPKNKQVRNARVGGRAEQACCKSKRPAFGGPGCMSRREPTTCRPLPTAAGVQCSKHSTCYLVIAFCQQPNLPFENPGHPCRSPCPTGQPPRCPPSKSSMPPWMPLSCGTWPAAWAESDCKQQLQGSGDQHCDQADKHSQCLAHSGWRCRGTAGNALLRLSGLQRTQAEQARLPLPSCLASCLSLLFNCALIDLASLVVTHRGQLNTGVRGGNTLQQ